MRNRPVAALNWIRANPSRVAALAWSAPAAFGLVLNLTNYPPQGDAGAVIFGVVVIGLLFAIFAYVGYRLWARPTRRLLLIVAGFDGALLLVAVVTNTLEPFWIRIADLMVVVFCALAWREERVAGPGTPAHA